MPAGTRKEDPLPALQLLPPLVENCQAVPLITPETVMVALLVSRSVEELPVSAASCRPSSRLTTGDVAAEVTDSVVLPPSM